LNLLQKDIGELEEIPLEIAPVCDFLFKCLQQLSLMADSLTTLNGREALASAISTNAREWHQRIFTAEGKESHDLVQ